MAHQKTANDQATARASRLGELKARADEHDSSREHAKAAGAHYERGEMHERAGNYKAASDAYKAAVHSMGRHAEANAVGSDCGWMRKGK